MNFLNNKGRVLFEYHYIKIQEKGLICSSSYILLNFSEWVSEQMG